MYKVLIAAFLIIAVGLWSLPAFASDFDGWSVDKIIAHPDFHPSDQSMSQTMTSAEPGEGELIYEWIGYIELENQRVYFTKGGLSLTCVKWDRTGEWVPKWVYETLEKLAQEGWIKM